MNDVFKRFNKVLKELESIVEDIQNNNLQNEQEVLNFMDKLNEVSISF